MFWRKKKNTSDLPVFCIVTPVFNGAAYIDDTIFSVLSQAGNFRLRYHVQDGGSTDDTMDRVRRWMKLSEKLPKVCADLTFTCSSEPDMGMYDAINKGFARSLADDDGTVMGWIAADDRIAPGAFSTIANIRAEFPDIRFLGGRISLLDHTGSVVKVEPLMPFSPRCMAAGLYDGRSMPFIMQEGTFWCADLWRDVGGLDTTFKLAGDWDLWRRMATHADYVCVDSLLGFHRRRPGQLSEQMDRYYHEVDQALAAPAHVNAPEILAIDGVATPNGRHVYESIATEHEVIKADPPRFRESRHSGRVVRFNLPEKRWERMDGFGAMPGAPKLVSPAGSTDSYVILRANGFKATEGPYPEFGLPAGINWMRGPVAEGEVSLPEAGLYRVVIRCRTWTHGQTVVVLDNGKPLGRLPVAPHGHHRDIELSVEGTFGDGFHLITISVDQPSLSDSHLLVIDWIIQKLPGGERHHILPVPLQQIGFASRVGTLPTERWPTISIVVPTRNQGHFIRDTLNSIIRQGYPNLELIVVDGGSTDETRAILHEYSAHFAHLIAEPDKGQSNAINKGFAASSGEILSWLNSDDLLADGALHAIAHAFMTSDFDVVAGVCDVFDDRNLTMHRHLPCISDGPLPLQDLLDIENNWLRGQFFHQPEVYFTRAIWNKIGGNVDEDLFYSMDYDLWVKMARYNATIKVIGSTVARYRMHPAQKTSTPEAYRPELTTHAKKLRQDVGISPHPTQLEVKSRLRIVFFNDYGFKYGAGIAHKRLALALAELGHEIFALAYADFDREKPSYDLSPEQVAEKIMTFRPDLVVVGNLHSIAADFDLLGSLLPSGVPTIFYAHDQWLGTGRCPYPGDCTRHTTLCDAACPTADIYPVLDRKKIAPAYRRRRATIQRADDRRFAILTNSAYMRTFFEGTLDSANRPPIHVAPIGVDTGIFCLSDKWHARMMLDLPQDRFIIMTAAASVTDERKGLPVLLRALEMLDDKDDILLMIMGYGTPISDSSIDIHYTGYLTEEAIIALHYQAADILVGPSLAEAFGQVYIEAGACGVPSVAFDVGGVSDAIIADVTGLLVRELTAPALSKAIGQLRSHPELRRKLGARARLHIANNFSLEASAAKFGAILVGEPVLGLSLAPCIVLSARPNRQLDVQYLIGAVGPIERNAHADWLPLRNLSEERATAETAHLPRRFWWASWPKCRFMVRSDDFGSHTLQLRVRSGLPDQRLTFSINDGPDQVVSVPPMDFNVTQLINVPVDLSKGVNLIDVEFAVPRDKTAPGMRDLTLLLEEVSIWGGISNPRNVPKDGSYELIEGFDAEEGPYPDLGLLSRFHWATGEYCKLRVFNANIGPRIWELKIRNPHQDQRLTIRLDNVAIATRVLADGSMQTNDHIRFEADVGVGFHTLSIGSTRQLDSPSDPRRLAFLFEELRLCSVGEACADFMDSVRWDLSSGVGPEEVPEPESRLFKPFRWFQSPKTAVVIERADAGAVILSMEFRSPVDRQSALLYINGQASGRIEFNSDGFDKAARIERPVALGQGQNLLEFEFAEMWRTPDERRDLFLLVEALTISSAPVDSDNLIAQQAPLAWACDSGFSIVEDAIPEIGLGKPFRWAMDGDSIIRFGEPMKRVKLLVRCNIQDQELEVFSGAGQLVATAALESDIALLQEIDVPLGEEGSSMIRVRPRIIAPASEAEPRRLVYILEGLAVETGPATWRISGHELWSGEP